MNLAQKISSLPTGPGVYQHKDAEGKVLYVGKAKNLKARVSTYFHENRQREGRLRVLLSKVVDVEVIVTDTEAEALILENNLIKQLRPRYNVNLKDDKTYPYIVVRNERFPRIFPTRRVRKDGSKYFGPFTDVKSMRLMLDTVRSIFRLRTCSLNLAPEPIAAGKYQVCLQYHIKKCEGPCVGYQAEADYAATVRQVEQLLNGKTGTLISMLREEMQRLAGDLRFEDAAQVRNRIGAIEKYAERQKVVSLEPVDRDLFALAIDRHEGIASAVQFQVRDGMIVGRRQQVLNRIEGSTDEELMQMVVERHYSEATFIPDEVFTATPLAEPDVVAEFLREQKGRVVTIHMPQRGEKAALLRMVASNAELLLEEYRQQRVKQGESRVPHAVRTLGTELRLPRPPRRIECFDISHLGGTGVVASCVVFEDGKPKPSEYRSFKVRTVGGGHSDDFASMKEVVARRYAALAPGAPPAADGDPSRELPDLVVIDGGKGQLSSAVEALQEIGLYGAFAIVGLAKRLEEVYVPGDSDPVRIARASTALQLLQRARNEAHRFAVKLQRKQREKKDLRTELTDIPGIGPKTAQKLIETFGSVKGVRAAPAELVAAAVGQKAAARVREHFASATPLSASEEFSLPTEPGPAE